MSTVLHKTFLKNFEPLLNIYISLKYKYESFLKKTTLMIQKCISLENYLSKFITLKDPGKKEEVQIRYNKYKNIFPTLFEKRKQSYFTSFFSRRYQRHKK